MLSGSLPQRGCLWQRNWTPAVDNALVEAKQHLGRVILLGAEIEWSGETPRVVRADIDWEQVRKIEDGRCSLALRVAPFTFPKEHVIRASVRSSR
ncbi:MAG: hypothetical protein ACREFG_12045 [Chthoniobacterales bacterium]